jgi:hypothetical protein
MVFLVAHVTIQWAPGPPTWTRPGWRTWRWPAADTTMVPWRTPLGIWQWLTLQFLHSKSDGKYGTWMNMDHRNRWCTYSNSDFPWFSIAMSAMLVCQRVINRNGDDSWSFFGIWPTHMVGMAMDNSPLKPPPNSRNFQPSLRKPGG